MKEEQEKDPECKEQLTTNPDLFCILHGIIYRKLKSNKIVPLIPATLRERVLQILHDSPSSGHMGVDKTFQRLKGRVYFKGMRKFVEDYIITCGPCQRNKSPNKLPAGKMGVKPITSPWHTLYIDLLGPYTPSTSNRYSYTFVIVDGFTKYVQLHPLREATAATIGKILEKEVFCRFSSPHTIVSDNATIFRSTTMKAICSKWGITHSFCSRYHPQTNLAERVNRVVKPMLRIYLEDKPHNKWSEQLPLLQLAINTAKHDSTGLTPY